MRLSGNTILITGGTSGIGRGLAEAFHARGNQVIIAGRRQELLDDVTAANPGMVSLPLDVQDPTAIDAFAAEVRSRFPTLDVLVNNAGISRPEDYAAGSPDIALSRSIIETNVVGVLHLTAALLPALRTRPHATIITTTSDLAFVPLAAYPTYCATKAFLHSWLQSLRFQLRETAVEVLELPPPYVQTELGGPQQATDPRAMPLADFIAEVMDALGDPAPPSGEILIDRVRDGGRFAERDGHYDRVFAERNAAWAT